MVHGISTIVKEEGIAGIYKGLLPTVHAEYRCFNSTKRTFQIMKQSGNQMTRFTVFNKLKEVVAGGDKHYQLALWQSLSLGAMAGFVSVYVLSSLAEIALTPRELLQLCNNADRRG